MIVLRQVALPIAFMMALRVWQAPVAQRPPADAPAMVEVLADHDDGLLEKILEDVK